MSLLILILREAHQPPESICRDFYKMVFENDKSPITFLFGPAETAFDAIRHTQKACSYGMEKLGFVGKTTYEDRYLLL